MDGVIISLEIGVVLLIGHLWCFCSMFATPTSFTILFKNGEWKIQQRFRWYVLAFMNYRYVQTWSGGKDATFSTREKAEVFLQHTHEQIEKKNYKRVQKAA